MGICINEEKNVRSVQKKYNIKMDNFNFKKVDSK